MAEYDSNASSEENFMEYNIVTRAFTVPLPKLIRYFLNIDVAPSSEIQYESNANLFSHKK